MLPGSKNLSNRVLLLSALARGTTKVKNLLRSDDIQKMLEALEQLKIQVDRSVTGNFCIIAGNGPLRVSREALNLGKAAA